MKNNVGLFYVDCGKPEIAALAKLMITSARAVIPDVNIIHMTGPGTTRLPGVDEYIVREPDNQALMEFRIDHYKGYEAHCLFLDPDVIIRKNPFHIFDQSFDVALTKRSGPLIVAGQDVAGEMPYNTGVIFSRNPKFWWEVHKEMRFMPHDKRNWFGDQVAVAKVAKRWGFGVLELPCEEYNYSPSRADEDLSARTMVHYKGRRKDFLLKKAA